MNNDKVYVIYFDGKMYDGYSQKRKSTYLKEGRAKQVISSDIDDIASTMCKDERGCCFYEMDKSYNEVKDIYREKAIQRFEIKVFMEV